MKGKKLNTKVFGRDKRTEFASEMLKSTQGDLGKKIILLPTPSTRDGIHITDTDIRISDIICELHGGEAVFGYGLSEELMKAICEGGAAAYDLSLDEILLEENARLTALGTLSTILNGMTADPDSLRIGILGFGRIGRHLARFLTFHGVSLVIFTSKKDLPEELRSVGVCSVETGYLGEESDLSLLRDLDILINTAPARIITDRAESALVGTKVIELASGNNIPQRLNPIVLPSIPGRMYPESAGRILFKSIVRFLDL